MVKQFITVIALILSGCSTYEYKGHYKFDEAKLTKSAKKSDVIKTFGNPLILPNVDNVFYYVYSKIYRNSFGFDSQVEAKIVRITFVNDVVESCKIIDFKDFKPDATNTPEPDMKFYGMFEMMHHIGKLANMEEGKERISDI